MKYRLKETDNFNNEIQNFDRNVQIKLDGDNFDLYLNNDRVAGKIINLKETVYVKVAQKGVTNKFIKNYTINIDKTSIIDNGKLEDTLYLPVLLEVINEEVVEKRDSSNILSDNFRSNILKIFVKESNLERFKKFYYSIKDDGNLPLEADLKTISATIEDFSIVANNKEENLSLTLFGLE